MLPCFGLSALYLLTNTWPCPPARHHSTAAHKALTYFNSWLSSQWRCVAPCPLFLSWFIIYLCSRWSSVPDCGHPGGQHTHQSPSAVSWVRIAHNNWGQFSYIRIALDGEYVCFHMIKKTKKSSNITTTFSSIFMTIQYILWAEISKWLKKKFFKYNYDIWLKFYDSLYTKGRYYAQKMRTKK